MCTLFGKRPVGLLRSPNITRFQEELLSHLTCCVKISQQPKARAGGPEPGRIRTWLISVLSGWTPDSLFGAAGSSTVSWPALRESAARLHAFAHSNAVFRDSFRG